jgi:hypothetical protein
MKPTVLWIADQPGWAYDSIFQQNSKLLPEYEHKVVYYMELPRETRDLAVANMALFADVIVAMYFRYVEKIIGSDIIVSMLTGMRPFE